MLVTTALNVNGNVLVGIEAIQVWDSDMPSEFIELWCLGMEALGYRVDVDVLEEVTP